MDELATRTRLGGGDGIANSDELLDAGSRGLRFFERFLPRYEQWTGHTLGGGMAAISATYYELRGIRFDRLRADADRLGEVHGELIDRHEQLAGNVNALHGLWDGDAATAADDYGSGFLRDGSRVADGVDVARALISMGTDRAESAVMTRAKLVGSLDSKHVGGLTPTEVDQVIAAARGTTGPEQLFGMVAMVAFAPLNVIQAFANVQSFTQMFDKASAWMVQRGTQWMDGVFVPSVEAAYQAFHQYTSTTTQDVGESWTGVTDGVGALNPVSSGPGSTAPTSYDPMPTTAPSGTAPVDGPVPGGSSNTPPSAVQQPIPTGDPDPVQVTTPSATPPPRAPTSASPVGTGVNRDPAPAAASEAHLAKAPSGSGGGQVGRAGDGLTLTKPDADGHAQLTVSRPDGSTADYQIDLGSHMGVGGQGQSMQGGVGGTTIHDGGMTITVHRPEGGQVVVTVDDGSGTPQSYPVDFDDSAPSGAGDASLASHDEGLVGGQGAAMAMGGHGGSSGTYADGSAGSGVGGLGGSGSGDGAPAQKPQPGQYSAVGESVHAPAAAASGGGGGAGRVAAAAGAGGMGMMPMMGGMGAGGAGKDHERQGGRWNSTEDFFSEDTSAHERIAAMLEPDLD